MPSRNIIKEYSSDDYYHVYSRGVAKQEVFLDEQDYETFLSLFKRYLSASPLKSPGRVSYPWFAPRLDLLAYCLMPNHVHMLVYQRDEAAMIELMRSIMTSYSMYFNRKYKRVGPVFQSRYKASRITQDDYLDHISRYIHLNPSNWEHYPYSSIKYYSGQAQADWLKPALILELFPSSHQYMEFVADYKGYKDMLDEIHWELADQ